MTRILIADDHEMIREGLRKVLDPQTTAFPVLRIRKRTAKLLPWNW